MSNTPFSSKGAFKYYVSTFLEIFNGAKLGVAPVARAPPLFLPRPELKYIYVLHTSAPPRTYLVRATLLLSPDWRHWVYVTELT